MNPFTDLLFTISWFVLLVWAIRSMARGWNLMTQPMRKNDIHPEMRDVKEGEQLLGVTFEKKTSCDLDEYQDLQNRINQLKSELEDPWDDDDDGDVPAVVKR
tara:strand:+ start:244 stop:549 length:306 start_codon:yes stop_codon:yes gene_type:complete